jgi:hypothetical protein
MVSANLREANEGSYLSGTFFEVLFRRSVEPEGGDKKEEHENAKLNGLQESTKW